MDHTQEYRTPPLARVMGVRRQQQQQLRMLLNDVINGGGMPLQWKENRVVLVYKGGDVS